jgi:hypothetical protein
LQVTGTERLGNLQGVVIDNGAAGNTVGGTAVGARNVISGNAAEGVLITGTGTNGNLVQGNYLGTDASGTRALGNSHGVSIKANASHNTIGRRVAGAGNRIAFNQGVGVRVESQGALGNEIAGNETGFNAGLGIDLVPFAGAAEGVTPNDDCDRDHGPNFLQNFPVLSLVQRVATGTRVAGFLQTQPGTPWYTLDVYASAAADPAEGHRYIGSRTLPGGPCGVSFDFILPAALGVGGPVTATATDPGRNTSEFSAPLGVTGAAAAGAAPGGLGVFSPGPDDLAGLASLLLGREKDRTPAAGATPPVRPAPAVAPLFGPTPPSGWSVCAGLPGATGCGTNRVDPSAGLTDRITEWGYPRDALSRLTPHDTARRESRP